MIKQLLVLFKFIPPRKLIQQIKFDAYEKETRKKEKLTKKKKKKREERRLLRKKRDKFRYGGKVQIKNTNR